MSTNPEPQPAAEFDPSVELGRFGDDEQDCYGLAQRIWFYAVMTARAVESFSTPSFTIERVFSAPGLTPCGCFIECVIKSHAFWIDVSATHAKLWVAEADDADGERTRYLVHDGPSDNPTGWHVMLQTIGRVEKFGVFVPHSDTLRRMWTQFLAERQRRDDDRGF